jgi:hypothetical protein
MSIYGTSSSPTYSVTFSGLDPLLNSLEDNFGNEITARNIRDAAFTLWDRIDGIDALISGITTSSAAGTASATSIFYDNPNPSTITVGGIPLGTTFSHRTIKQMFDDLLYPYTPPILSVSIGSNISIPGASREFGATTSVIFNWTVSPRSQDVNIINSIPPALPGQTTIIYTGPFSTSVSHTNNFVAVQNVTSIFSINAIDSTSNYNASAYVNWYNRLYWGKIDLSSYGNPNFTLNPGAASSIVITSAIILGLSGAGIGSGNELSSGLSKSYNGINGGGQYLLFAWPTSFGTPSFSVNGLPNTAFTKLKSGFTFTNFYGYQNSYDVWISNTLQGSPLNVTIS